MKKHKIYKKPDIDWKNFTKKPPKQEQSTIKIKKAQKKTLE